MLFYSIFVVFKLRRKKENRHHRNSIKPGDMVRTSMIDT